MWSLLFISAILVLADGRVLRQFEIPPEGVSMDIIMSKNPSKPHGNIEPISALRLNMKGNKIVLLAEDVKLANDLPELDNRFALRGDMCPTGYEKRGGFCFPEPPSTGDEDYSS